MNPFIDKPIYTEKLSPYEMALEASNQLSALANLLGTMHEGLTLSKDELWFLFHPIARKMEILAKILENDLADVHLQIGRTAP